MTLLNLKALAIREYWENRGLLFKTPMFIAIGLLLAGTIAIVQLTSATQSGLNKLDETTLKSEMNNKNIWPFDYKNEKKADRTKESPSTKSKSKKKLENIHRGIFTFAFIVSVIVSFYYLAQALFSDRKDRSILFWRSLPVTEWETITSKLVVGIFGFPIFYLGFATLTLIGLTIVLYIASLFLDVGASTGDTLLGFSTASFTQYFKSLAWAFVMNLSLLPLYCWLMFFSAFSKKNPTLLSLTVPLVLIIAEAVLLQSFNIVNAVGKFFNTLYFNAKAVSSLDLESLSWDIYAISLAISIALFVGTHWLRNNRHEI